MQPRTDFGQGVIQLSSLKNEKVKYVTRLLTDSKLRKSAKAFVIEGVRLFSEVPEEDILDVFYTEGIEEKINGGLSSERAAAAVNKLKQLESKGKTAVVTSEVYKKLSNTENPQGITAVVRAGEYTLEDVIGENSSFILIIDRLQDPGNLGTIIRTAEGAGVTGIVLSSDSVDRYNPKVVRGTMGSILRMPIYVSRDMVNDINTLKMHGIRIYGTHLNGTDMYEEDFTGGIAFLIGNEGRGLSDAVSETADRLIRIPMQGKVESLNAGISASIVCYEAFRQRRG